MKDTFYEVNLSDCDGINLTVHVWKSGTVEVPARQLPKFRRLMKFYRDNEAPEWVLPTLLKRMEKTPRRRTSP